MAAITAGPSGPLDRTDSHYSLGNDVLRSSGAASPGAESIESGLVDERAEEYNPADDWDFDDYWPKEEDKIDPRFSLGEICKFPYPVVQWLEF